jgi:hypothetical protein
MKSKICIACFAVLFFSCENSTENDPEKDDVELTGTDKPEVKETAVTVIREVEESKSEKSLNGVYKNGDGELHIMNADENGFEYSIVMNSPDDCEGIDYEGTAIYKPEGPSVYGSESIAKGSADDINPIDEFENDTFYIRDGGAEIQMDASFSMIGMECAKFGNMVFQKEGGLPMEH